MLPGTNNDDFLKYIAALEPLLAEHGRNSDELQEYQVNHLVKLEKEFRKALVRHPRGLSEVYPAFVTRTKNILTARPFFRERDETFKAHISKALKEKDPHALTRFNINRTFIDFVLALGGWERDKAGRKLLDIAKRHLELRSELIECNLPLAISQARTFYGRNPQSHLDYMDFNQIAAVGLMEAVDKFSGPWKTNFRAVAIGRMKGNFIEENSSTYAHFYPTERKVLYRARKLLRTVPKDGPVDFETVHRKLNLQEREAGDEPTGMSEMLHILAASQVLLQGGVLPGGDEADEPENLIEKFPDAPDARPDALLEAAQTRLAVANAIKGLSLFHQKLIRMRGVDLS